MTNPSELMAQAESYAKTDVANRGPRHAEVAPTNPSDTRDSELVRRLRNEATCFETDGGADPEVDAGTARLLREAADTIDRLTSTGEALTWPPIIELGKTLAFYTSVIKSGESWSPECAAAYDRANKALQDLYADLGASPREGHVEVPVGVNTDAEWELEQRAFDAANHSDVPEWAQKTVADLWRQYCLATEANQGETKPEAWDLAARAENGETNL